jgi:photosystem II stability/assembly factor-like uncharacterized protein
MFWQNTAELATFLRRNSRSSVSLNAGATIQSSNHLMIGISMKRVLVHVVVAFSLLITAGALAEEKSGDAKDPMTTETFNGLAFRNIGPALTSGRVNDFAVNPANRDEYYVVAASGGVWKTINAGTTWESVFDGEGSYSIGCITMDPTNPSILWVGSGENNSQRSVSYGDGVYRTDNGGKTWENVGLKGSEHIGKILIDPRQSGTVYVAAQGPLWGPGGDRGLYKTTDNGKHWSCVLKISENTGVTDVVMDPRNPDVIIAASYQRRRHVWTVINGGPESAIHKSTDGGTTWVKLTEGLPAEDMGRIGLAISPVNPDIVFAIVELANKKGGIYRSTNRGASWEKRSDYVSGSGQYYNELICDPRDVDRVYSMDVYLRVTTDGGKTFRNLGEKSKHVDNHAIWIDPDNTNYYLVGCDGGIYESFDRAATWSFKANLPITQFYRVAVDNATPFYNVYGGTQDNFSLGGPSRTISSAGIVNADWLVTTSGDGFVTRIDPEDPNIVYSESQYGGLVRFDKKSGEGLGIKPQEAKGENGYRWNWDSPLLISPHSHTRLYFAANFVFRSDDRGNTWTKVSSDLTRQIDRNKLPVMGKVWGVDAIAKNASTSLYGNIVSMVESPVKEGTLYVGTDDGLIQLTMDGGASWKKLEKFPGVPEMTYVSALVASQHEAATVYAAFDNHQNSDFRPYLLKSVNGGETWTPIAGNLPERGTVYSIAEDHVNKNLLFAGTEFGVFFTVDGGKKWIQLKGGLPTIAVRDIAIQKRENDLVLGTFGRGFYILDDYTPLRTVAAEGLSSGARLFTVKNAPMYVESRPYGYKGRGFMGESFYAAPNPPLGATFTYFLDEALKTKKKIRQGREKELIKSGKTPPYPTYEDLRAEDEEEVPAIIVSVTDASGKVVRNLTGPTTRGINRVTWDVRFAPLEPVSLSDEGGDAWSESGQAPLALPGTYTVSLAKRVNGVTTPIGVSQSFTVAPLGGGSLPIADRFAHVAFQRKVADLQRAVLGASRLIDDVKERATYLRKAALSAPATPEQFLVSLRSLETRINDIVRKLRGDRTLSSRNEAFPPAIIDRVTGIIDDQWLSTGGATQTHMRAYAVASEEFEPVLAEIKALVEVDLRKLEGSLESLGAPWTPGRIPEWKK